MAGKTKSAATLNDEEIDAATRRGKEAIKHEPRATSVAYEAGRVRIETDKNWGFSFAPAELSELEHASVEELADVKILGSGSTIEWTTLDAHVGVGAIISELLGDEFLISEGNRRVAARTSLKKAASSAANGRLGGRPRKAEAGGK